LPNQINEEALTKVVDFTSIGVLLGSLVNILPAVAAIFTIVWTCIRIYETKTIQKWLNK